MASKNEDSLNAQSVDRQISRCYSWTSAVAWVTYLAIKSE